MKPYIKYPAFKADILPFIALHEHQLVVTKYRNRTTYQFNVVSPNKSIMLQYSLLERGGAWQAYFSVAGGSHQSNPKCRQISFAEFKSKFNQYYI